MKFRLKAMLAELNMSHVLVVGPDTAFQVENATFISPSPSPSLSPTQVPFLGEVIPDYHRNVLLAAGQCLDHVTWHWYVTLQ
jgi:hypothetical protein